MIAARACGGANGPVDIPRSSFASKQLRRAATAVVSRSAGSAWKDMAVAMMKSAYGRRSGVATRSLCMRMAR